MPKIQIRNAGLDELAEGDSTKIILRGIIDPDSLQHLKTDDYQREAQPLASQASILSALKAGEPLPDIELGMRGQRFESEGDVFLLGHDVYIVDGLQRVTTAIHFLGTNPNRIVRLGATVHFDTTREWERARFIKLNSNRLKVSPSVLLRNMRDDSQAAQMLHTLSVRDQAFAMHCRVSWTQRMSRGELLTALIYLRTVGILHTHKAAAQRTTASQLVPALDRAYEVLGVMAMRENVKTFFDLVDECWGIRRVSYREGASHLRGTFLFVLAKFLSDHYDFWQGNEDKKLFVSADHRRKIKTFPVGTDTHVNQLTGSSGKARQILYALLVDHVNSGKRTKKLRSRNPGVIGLEEETDVAA